MGEGTGGDTPRLCDVDAASRLPEPEGDAGRFAGAGFSRQDGDGMAGDRSLDLGAEIVYWQSFPAIHGMIIP